MERLLGLSIRRVPSAITQNILVKIIDKNKKPALKIKFTIIIHHKFRFCFHLANLISKRLIDELPNTAYTWYASIGVQKYTCLGQDRRNGTDSMYQFTTMVYFETMLQFPLSLLRQISVDSSPVVILSYCY